MKVYSISKWAFWGICILILSLPVSRQWKLIVSGNKASGTVTAFTLTTRETLDGDKQIIYASEIEFSVEGKIHKAYGPVDYEYDTGRKVNVLYETADPSSYCILTFSGFYFNNYLAIPIFLMILWGAFYLSFNRYSKGVRIPRKTR